MQAINNSSLDINTKVKRGEIVFKVLMHILMIIIALILVFPYFYMVMKSLMTQEEVISSTFKLFPSVPQFSNYTRILQDSGYLAAFGHTMLVIVFNLIAVPLSATFVAFGFARCKFYNIAHAAGGEKQRKFAQMQ